jgi:hypothetical protein
MWRVASAIDGRYRTTVQECPSQRQSARSALSAASALGIEALQPVVTKRPLHREHKCVFGVLTLESPVDPVVTIFSRVIWRLHNFMADG